MKQLMTLLIALVVSGSALATTNFQQGAGNTVGTNADETFKALIDACGDVSILGLRARARLEMNQSTPEGKAKIVELMDQAMATCGGGDIVKATEQMNEAIAIGKASVTENFGTDASAETPVNTKATPADEESSPPLVAIIAGLAVIIGIVVMMRRKRAGDDDE